MTLKLNEGQDFTDRYSLLHKITSTPVSESSIEIFFERWLAIDLVSNERVMISVYPQSRAETNLTRLTPDQVLATLTDRFNSVRGLIHPNVARTLEVGLIESQLFTVSQYFKSFDPLDIHLPLPRQRKQIAQLFDAMAYAHGLGIAHGALYPGNLLTGPGEELVITGFVHASVDSGFTDYIYPYASPRIIAGDKPDLTDDIYAIGALLYRLLTLRDWQPGRSFESDQPISTELRHYVEAMLAANASDRPTDLAAISLVVDANTDRSDEASSRGAENIIPAAFAKATPDKNTSATTSSATQDGTKHPNVPMSRNGQQFTPIVEHATPRERSVMSASSAFVIFALIAALGGIVFFYLPTLVPAPRGDISTQVPAPAPAKQIASGQIEDPVNQDNQPVTANGIDTPLAPMEAALRERLILDGKNVATELLRKQLELEDLAVYLWNEPEYSAIVEFGLAGDEFYRLENYQAAMDNYQEAMNRVEGLLNQVEDVRILNQDRGEVALLEGDEATAREAYKILNAIDPGNPEIEHALVRANNLGRVLASMKSGLEFEQNRELESALASFDNANKLDPDWEPAIIAIERVETAIVQSRFNDAMSRAFTALADQKYEMAILAFKEAGEIIPESSEPADGLLQIEIAKKQNEFSGMQKAAALLVEQEAWAEALQAYKNALDQDSTLVFAKEGYQLALKRNSLDLAMDRYIGSPAVMSKDSELAKAKKILVQASREKVRGPKLQQQINDLSLYISLARIPVELQIQSDGKTDVNVYRVSNLGKISRTSLKLVPGSYTIVGTRKGYRDVHENITLLGGRGIISIDVSCTEKI